MESCLSISNCKQLYSKGFECVLILFVHVLIVKMIYISLHALSSISRFLNAVDKVDVLNGSKLKLLQPIMIMWLSDPT